MKSAYCSILLWWLAALRVFCGDSVVVFNEVMYHPRDGDGVEWIELYNQMAVDVEISGWSIDGADYIFPTNSIVPGGQYLVIASDPVELARRSGQTNIFGPLAGKLSNSGEKLRLINHNGRVMDELDFQTDAPWPAGPDGSGFTLAKLSPSAGSDAAANWSHSTQAGGTPGAANFPASAPVPAIYLSELSASTNQPFWIELVNRSSNIVALGGIEIEFPRGPSAFRLDAGASIDPGGFQLFYPTGYVAKAGEKIFLYSARREQLLDAAEIQAAASARSFASEGGWLLAQEATPGASNLFGPRPAIVINELMYSGMPGETNSAWIELFNRGSSPVDLSAWKLSGVDFVFPPATTMQPGEYIVVAQNTAQFHLRFPAVRALGNFQGKLSGSSDHLVLRDRFGSPVDEVRYFDGEPWPPGANTKGISLELRDPRADNSKPEAWAASVQPGEWQSYTYTATAASDNGPTRWNEFIFGLLDAGELLLDDFSVIENPGASGREILQNGSFEKGSATWRFLGTHRQAEVIEDPDNAANHVLHLVADGPTEHMHNHVETTLANNQPIRNGTAYKISWRAKWLAGEHRLNTRLYFNRVARTTELARPEIVATPGRPNSTAAANTGPTFADLVHSPAVPRSTQSVQVSVRAADPDGVRRCRLWSSADSVFWTAADMTVSGDAYTASLPARAAGIVVQFYVEAEDALGAISFYPAAGRNSRALYKVNDNQSLSSRLHNFRLIMPLAEANALHASTNVMSNGRSLCTVIYDESEVFYNCGLHLQSSERGRMDNSRVGFTLSFPADHLFRGLQDTITFDRSGGWSGRGGRQDEIVIRHIINQAGDSPDMYNDLVRVLTPLPTHTGTAMLLGPKYGKQFIDDSVYPKDGSLYKLELIYYPATSVGNDPQRPKLPQPDDVIGTDIGNLGGNLEAYRWFYPAENGVAAEDYSGLAKVAQSFSFSGAALQQRTSELLDLEQWTRVFAFKSLSGDVDTYGFGLPHNQLIYVPPAGKALTFPWDLDFAWTRGARDTINVGSRLGQIIHTIPVNERLYFGNLRDILDTSYNTNYMARWTAHYGSLAGQNYSQILTYIGDRAKSARSQLPALVPFAITTFPGSFFQTNATSIVLQGTAPYTLKRLQINDQPPAAGFTWTAVQNWQTTVPLAYGSNVVALAGYDFHNRAIVTNQVVIVSNLGSPDRDRDGMPDAWEIKMGLDPNLADAELDADLDGLSNLNEYLAGTDPLDPASTLRLAVTAAVGQQFNLTFAARAGHAYRLEYRTSVLDRWNTLTRISADNGDRTITQPQTISSIAPALFYRLVLER